MPFLAKVNKPPYECLLNLKPQDACSIIVHVCTRNLAENSHKQRNKITVIQLWRVLRFTKYTLSVSLGKCSTIVSNRFTRLSFNIVRCSYRRLPSAIRPTDVDSYIFCLAYVVRPLSLIKLVFPKVVYSCIPTHSYGLADLIL